MARKKPSPPPKKPRRRAAAAKATRKPAAAALDDAILQKVILLLVSHQNRAVVAQACAEKLDIPAAIVPAVLQEARRQLTLAADFHRTEELGKAIKRLDDCYARSLAIQDVKTALAAQKEMNRLLDLYRPLGSATSPDDAHAETAEELAAVREYLEPLGLGGPEVSVAELARRAVAHFTRSPAPQPA